MGGMSSLQSSRTSFRKASRLWEVFLWTIWTLPYPSSMSLLTMRITRNPCRLGLLEWYAFHRLLDYLQAIGPMSMSKAINFRTFLYFPNLNID